MGRDELSTRPRLGWIMIAGVFVGFWPLATLSKENGVLLPLLVALVEWTFFPRGAASKSTRVLRHSLAFVLGLSLLITALSVAMNPGWLVADYTSREFTAAQRLLTQPRVMLDYAANLLLVPGGSALGIYHDDFPVSIDAWTPWTTLPAAALVIGIPLVAVIALIASARRPTMLGLVLFGPTFFIAALLLESTVLPLEMYFEHRAYLPGAGLFLGMGLALMHLPASLRSRRILTVAIVAVPLGYAVTTLERAAIWRSWESVLLASAQTHHGAGRVQTGLASLYINRGDAPRAHEHLNRARTLYRERHRLALALHRLALYCPGTIPAPEETYRTLEAVTGDTVDVYAANALGWLAGARDRGLCRSLDGVRIAEAVAAKLGDSSHTSRTSPVHPRWQMHVHLGRWMASLDRRRDSIAHLLKAFELRPNVLAPGLEAAQLQLSERDFAAARRTLARLRAADTGRIRRQSNLLKSYLARLP